jgi:LAO/AO transport system kinase
VQVAKAGILEIADVFVVNKSDREGADAAARDLEQMIRMGSVSEWTPPVVRTSVQGSEGIDELWEAMDRHRAHLEERGQLEQKRRGRLLREVEGLAGERLRGGVRDALARDRELADEIAARTTDPYRAADILIERLTRAEEP